MRPRLHNSSPPSPWACMKRTLLLLCASLCLLAPNRSEAIELGWSRTGEEVIFGEVTDFDFEKKTVTITETDTDKKKTISSSDLDARGKWMLIFSSQFLNSIPEDIFGKEHLILILIFIVIPIVLYLVTFWFCAVFVMGRINPLRALIALPGAWLMSGFLIVFYVFMIGRYPEKMQLICILGGMVTLTVASLFVAIIYHKNILHGLTLIVLHSILAPVIFASAIYLPYKFGDPEKVDTLFANTVFIPAGLLQGENNEE